MAKQVINISTPNDGAGDTLYVGGGKINANFTELYTAKPTTIGTGGDYTTVGAAIAAGKSGIFLLTSSVSETGSTSLTTGNEAPIYIFSNGKFTWNLNTRAFSYRALKHIFVDVINANFSDNNVLSKTYIYGTSVTIVPSYTYYINHSGCSVTVPNAQCFCNYSLFENCSITPSNTASRIDGAGFKNNTFLGTWGGYLSGDVRGVFNNNVYAGNTVTNVAVSTTSDTGILEMSGNRMQYVNFACIGAGGAYLRLANNFIKSVTTFGVHYIDAVNTKFGGAFSFTGGKFNLANCHFLDNITISVDDVTLTACKVGLPGGGVKKITISAGINDTVIRDLRTEAATTDGGTGSVITEKIW